VDHLNGPTHSTRITPAVISRIDAALDRAQEIGTRARVVQTGTGRAFSAPAPT